MTDKEKARELAIAYFSDTNEQGERIYDARCEAACQEMAKWMQEQMIDKACEWLKDQKEMIGISFENDFIERFRKAMEDEK